MNRIKETIILLLLLLLTMPAETFAQSAGGQITRRAKTAVKKESPAKKKTVRSSTHSSKKKTERTSPSTKQKPSTTSATQSAAKRETCPPTPTAVDLGLPSGTLWADRNIGANSPEGYGDYFAWGETRPKSVYNESTYKYSNGSSSSLTKYCTNSNYGTIDNNTILEASDDAATANWGSNWRMPTHEEQVELNDKCKWTWTTRNGVKGYKVTGPNGNSIFFPAASCRNDSSVSGAGSYGYYWSASLSESDPDYAWNMDFYSDFNFGGYGSYRYYGRSVRAVTR